MVQKNVEPETLMVVGRCMELRQTGRSWADICEVTKLEGFHEDTKKRTLEVYWGRHRDKIPDRLLKPDRDSETARSEWQGIVAELLGAEQQTKEKPADSVLRQKTPHTSRDKESPVPPVLPENTQDAQFDEATLADIREMLKWWKDHGGPRAPMPGTTQVRPDFKRGKAQVDQVIKTVRIHKDMARMAERRAKEEKARTGGTFNGLVEVLLWEYLGCPEELLAPEETED